MHACTHTHSLQSCAMSSMSFSFTFCSSGNGWGCPDNTRSNINTMQPRQEKVIPSYGHIIQWRKHTAVATPYNYLIWFWQLPFVEERKMWTLHGKGFDERPDLLACEYSLIFLGRGTKCDGTEVSSALFLSCKRSRCLLSAEKWAKVPVTSLWK